MVRLPHFVAVSAKVAVDLTVQPDGVASFSYQAPEGFSRLALSRSASNAALGLSTAERSLAADECYDLSTSGSVTTRRAKLHTLANIRFAFDILAKVEGNEFQLDVSQGGWQLLQRSMKIRDRLMHPKAASDLRVSDEEIRDSVRAFMWFEKQLVRLLLVTINAVRGQHSRLMEELAQGLEDSSLPPPMAH